MLRIWYVFSTARFPVLISPETIRKPCQTKLGPSIQLYTCTVGLLERNFSIMKPRRRGSFAIVKIPKLSFCRYPVVPPYKSLSLSSHREKDRMSPPVNLTGTFSGEGQFTWILSLRWNFRGLVSLIVAFLDFDWYWIACAFVIFFCEFRNLVWSCLALIGIRLLDVFMSFDFFWLFLCRLILEIFEVWAFGGVLCR